MSTIQVLKCPSCGAAVNFEGGPQATIVCKYCDSTVIVPEELRGAPAAKKLPPNISPEKYAEIKKYWVSGNKLMAIKIYREITLVGLEEAKTAIQNLIAG